MRYEIITDLDDMLVFLVNGRIVAISSDMDTVISLLKEDYVHQLNKTKREYKKALIYPELDVYTDKEEIPTEKEPLVPNKVELSKLFRL